MEIDGVESGRSFVDGSRVGVCFLDNVAVIFVGAAAVFISWEHDFAVSGVFVNGSTIASTSVGSVHIIYGVLFGYVG